jgi:WD40 repeat protein
MRQDRTLIKKTKLIVALVVVVAIVSGSLVGYPISSGNNQISTSPPKDIGDGELFISNLSALSQTATPTHSAGNSARIRGTIYARMMDGSFGPLRGAKFILYDPDLSILSISYTDWSGRFDSGWIPNVPYVYQTVIAETQSDWGVVILNGVGDRYAVNRIINGPFVDDEYDVGLFYVEGNAWRIYDTIVKGWSFLYNQTSYHMPQVTVLWPCTSVAQPIVESLKISLPEGGRFPNIEAHPDIILHEYSDVVGYRVYGVLLDSLPNQMWGDGWSDFFSCAVRDNPVISEVGGLVDPQGNPTISRNLETRKNVDNTNDSSFYDESDPRQEGRSNTASALWDLYDPWLDNLDIVNFSFGNLWDIFTTKPANFESFWQRLKSELLTWPPDGSPYRDAHYAKAAVFQNGKPWVNNAPSSSIGGLTGTWQISPVTLSASASDSDWEDVNYLFVTFEYSTTGGNPWTTIGTDSSSPYSVTWNPSFQDDSVWVRATASDGMKNSNPSTTGPFGVQPVSPIYTLSTSVTPSGAGTVSGGGSYVSGASVTLTATAASGYQFSSWSGYLSGSTNPMTFTMPAQNVSVTANFSQIPTYTLSTSVTPSGSGTVSPSSGSYTAGTQVTLTAYPASDYVFDYWSGDASGSNSSVTITMDSNKSVVAHFKTASSVIIITTVEQLQEMKNNLSAHYALGNDIDASDTVNWNGGAGFEPIGNYHDGTQEEEYYPFTGSFDGQGHKIFNLYIYSFFQTYYVGLFGLNEGTVSNVGLENLTIWGGWDIGGGGGLVGWNYGGTISNCYSTGEVVGDGSIGGLIGFANWGTVSNCYSTCIVDSGFFAGGLVGEQYRGIVSNSYSTGSVNGYVEGGLVGYNYNGTVSNSFYDKNTSGQSDTGKGTGKTTAEMKTKATFTDAGWDFVTIWDIHPAINDGYPSFTWAHPDVIEIRTVGELQAMRDNLSANYVLVNDIDASATRNWNGGAGFIPIGRFTGSFDGWGYKIYNLYINRPATNYVGLFGVVESGGVVENVGLENENVIGKSYVGGLVGASVVTVSNCYSTGTVSGGGSYVGGLVGWNDRTVSNCYSTGTVSGGGSYVGGLVGINYEGWVKTCYSTGTVSGSYSRNTAGGVWLPRWVKTCYSTGTVSGSYSVGGLVGGNDHEGYVINSYSTGSVSGGDEMGGLVGYNDGYVINSYSTGSVSGGNEVGGLVGYVFGGSVSGCYSTGAVSGSGEKVGGLVGINGYYADVSGCYSTGFVSGDYNVGGLVGCNEGAMSNCYSMGDVSGSDGVGGLIGYSYGGTVSNSYSTGTVSGSSCVGGLVGRIVECGIVSNCYSTGSVSGDYCAGGLVGYNWGIVYNSYSTGTVSGGSYVGGLIGWNEWGIVSNCYSTGFVSGDYYVGGLVGSNYALGTVSNSFWDNVTSWQATSDGGTGKTTAEMKTKATFTDAGWDFLTIWNIGYGYPFLTWAATPWSYYTGSNVESVSISSDGSYIAAGCYDGNVYLFSKYSDTPLWSCDVYSYLDPFPPEDIEVRVSISSDGDYVAVSIYKSITWDDPQNGQTHHKEDGSIFLFSKDSGTPLWYYKDIYTSVSISSDGSYIAAGTGGYSDHKVYFFSKESSTPLWSYTAGSYVKSVSISSDGNYIAAGGGDKKVYLFSKDSSTPLWSYNTGSYVYAVSISSDGSYIAAGGYDKKVYLFSKNSSTPIWSSTTGGEVNLVSISSDGNYIAAGTGYSDYKVYFFSKDSSTPLWSYTAGGYVNSVSIFSNGSYIAVGGYDYKVYLFSKDSSTPLWSYDTDGCVSSVSISSNGNYIAAGDDGNVYLLVSFI